MNGVSVYYRHVLEGLADDVDLVIVGNARGDTQGCDAAARGMGLAQPWWTPEVEWLAPYPGAVDKIVGRIAPDLIHVPDGSALSVAALRSGRRRGIPVGAVFHTDLGGFSESTQLLRRTSYFISASARTVYRSANHVAAISASAANTLATIRGCSVGEIRILPPGVDCRKFYPNETSHSTSAKPPRILTVSRLSPEKRIETIISSHRQLPTSMDAELCIVGRGPSARRLRRIAGPRTFFMGALDELSLGHMYRESDVFVLASRAETFGQVLLEAQASGLPCIVSPSGAAQSTIAPGVSGLVATTDTAEAFAEAIQMIIEDKQARKRLIRGARARALGMSWSTATDELSRWYVEIGDRDVSPC
jgi:glycosyltransferase involved in cell wall biosynthesis